MGRVSIRIGYCELYCFGSLRGPRIVWTVKKRLVDLVVLVGLVPFIWCSLLERSAYR